MTDLELIKRVIALLPEVAVKATQEPTRMMAMPELMERAGWVPKREWVGLTPDDWPLPKFEYSVDFQVGAQWAEKKLREKNS